MTVKNCFIHLCIYEQMTNVHLYDYEQKIFVYTYEYEQLYIVYLCIYEQTTRYKHFETSKNSSKHGIIF